MKLNSSFQEFIITQKIMETIDSSDKIDNEKLMKEIKDRMCEEEDRFNYSKPAVQKKND